MCLGLSESEITFELTKYLLLEGKCQFCGGPVFALDGIPGPRRRVYCYQCGEKRGQE